MISNCQWNCMMYIRNNLWLSLDSEHLKRFFFLSSMCHKRIWWLFCSICLLQLLFKPTSLYFLRKSWKITSSITWIKKFIFCIVIFMYSKKLLNNWKTKATQQLKFSFDGRNCLVYWDDVLKFYEEDRENLIHFTKRHLSVNSKLLLR